MSAPDRLTTFVADLKRRGWVKTVLALDLGTRTGWALWNGDRVESGVQVFDVKRGESPGMRYLRFNRWLDDVTHTPQVRLIVYEQAHQRGGAATEVAAGFTTRVQEFCVRAACHPIEHAAVHSATLKKWTTGRGNAKKPEMMAAVKLKGWADHVSILTDDEADALALLHYARAEF